MPVRGGQNLKRLLSKAQTAVGVKGVRVGWYKSAVYPRIGTGAHGKRQGYRRRRYRIPVTTVAAWIEFGTRSRSGRVRMKARPVMRRGNATLELAVGPFFKSRIDPETMVVTVQLAGQWGVRAVTEYQRAMHTFDKPPIDTGFYKRSLTWEVIED